MVDFSRPFSRTILCLLIFDSPVLVTLERLSSRIAINGLVAKVLQSVCIVHTLAASCRSHVGAVDLYLHNSVSVLGRETCT